MAVGALGPAAWKVEPWNAWVSAPTTTAVGPIDTGVPLIVTAALCGTSVCVPITTEDPGFTVAFVEPMVMTTGTGMMILPTDAPPVSGCEPPLDPEPLLPEEPLPELPPVLPFCEPSFDDPPDEAPKPSLLPEFAPPELELPLGDEFPELPLFPESEPPEFKPPELDPFEISPELPELSELPELPEFPEPELEPPEVPSFCEPLLPLPELLFELLFEPLPKLPFEEPPFETPLDPPFDPFSEPVPLPALFP